jgi:hypothetical protein
MSEDRGFHMKTGTLLSKGSGKESPDWTSGSPTILGEICSGKRKTAPRELHGGCSTLLPCTKRDQQGAKRIREAVVEDPSPGMVHVSIRSPLLRLLRDESRRVPFPLTDDQIPGNPGRDSGKGVPGRHALPVLFFQTGSIIISCMKTAQAFSSRTFFPPGENGLPFVYEGEDLKL